MASLVDVFVSVRPDLSGFDKEVRDRVARSGSAVGAGETQGKKAGGGFVSGFGKAAAGVAAAGAAALVGGGIALTRLSGAAKEAASSQEQSFGAVESVFGKASDRVKALAKDASNAVGLSQAEYAQMSAVFGSQLRNMGIAADQLAPKSQELIGLGSDLAAMYGGTVSEAVDAVSSLLRGETDPIERYGVSIKQADIEARLAAEGLDKLEGSAEKTARTQATLALLNEQSASAVGQFARESNTAAGVDERRRAQMENLKATLGTALLPAYVAVGKAVNEQFLPPLQAAAEKYGPQLSAWITNSAVPALGSLMAGLQGKGPIDGFSGDLNTAGLAVRAFFASVAEPDVTSDGAVGTAERLGSAVRSAYDAVKGFDWSKVREGGETVAAALSKAYDAVQRIDWSAVGAGVGDLVGDGDSASASLGMLADNAKTLSPLVGELAANTPSLSDGLAVMGSVTGFLADHVDTLAKYMPLLIGAFIAVKAAQAAANLALAAGVPLRIAEIISNQRHTAALAANTAALGGNAGAQNAGAIASAREAAARAASSARTAVATAATRVATGVQAAYTAATNGTALASARAGAAAVAQRVASVALSAVTKGMAAAQWLLNAAMSANPIGLVIAAIAALVAGLVYAYKNSETFRNIVDGALRAVGDAGKWLWERALKPAIEAIVGAIQGFVDKALWLKDNWRLVWDGLKELFRLGAIALLEKFLGMVESIVSGAAKAFGWVPGLGPKLEEAAGKIAGFRDAANKALGGIEDREVNVKAQLDAGAKYLAQTRGMSASEAAATARKMLADGGAVNGRGTGRSDSIPALLSRNEHVWTEREVAAAGGHQKVEAMRQQVLRRAEGGPIEERFRIAASVPSADPLRALAADLNASSKRLVDEGSAGVGALRKAYNGRAAETSAGEGGAGTFRPPTGIGGKSVAALVAYGRALRAQGLRVSSNRALGSPPTPGAHSSTGYHYRYNDSGAIDVNSHAGESPAEKRRLTPVALDALRRGFGVQWLSSGHFNHLHVDVGNYRAVGNTSRWLADGGAVFDAGGRASGLGVMAKGTLAPERVLSPRQTTVYEQSLPLLEHLVRALDAGATGGGDVYVENPFTGDYLLAQVARVADDRVGVRSRARSSSATFNPGG